MEGVQGLPNSSATFEHGPRSSSVNGLHLSAMWASGLCRPDPDTAHDTAPAMEADCPSSVFPLNREDGLTWFPLEPLTRVQGA